MHGEYFLLRRARRGFLHPDRFRKRYGKSLWGQDGEGRGPAYVFFTNAIFWTLWLTYLTIVAVCWTIFLGILGVMAFLLIWVMVAVI